MTRSAKTNNNDEKKQPHINRERRRGGKKRSRKQDNNHDGNESFKSQKSTKSPHLSQPTEMLNRNGHDGNISNNNNNMRKTSKLEKGPKSKSRNRHETYNNPTNKEPRNQKQPPTKRSAQTKVDSNPPGTGDGNGNASGNTSSKSRKRKQNNKKKQNNKNHHNDHNHFKSHGQCDHNYKEQVSSLSKMNNSKEINNNEINKKSNSTIQQQQQQIVLEWDSPYHPVSIKSEEAILPLLMKYGSKERGMFKDQKSYRIQKIKQACDDNDIRLDQALSLRRHHILNLNPFNSMPKLGLGSYEDIKASSVLFEESVSMYLTNKNKNKKDHGSRKHCNTAVPFWNEEEQKERFHNRCNSNQGKGSKNKCLKTPPTPDFLLHSTIQIVKKDPRSMNGNNNDDKHHSNDLKSPFDVNWIDAKMFYGASTIQFGTKNAVGSLLATAKKYVASYGQGAFVFYNGYGDKLEEQLLKEGVLVLDASPLDLRHVVAHQRKWCGNNKGEILA